MSSTLRSIIWMLTHPMQTFRIYTCWHDDIDFETLKCNRCGKQFKFMIMGDYKGKMYEKE